MSDKLFSQPSEGRPEHERRMLLTFNLNNPLEGSVHEFLSQFSPRDRKRIAHIALRQFEEHHKDFWSVFLGADEEHSSDDIEEETVSSSGIEQDDEFTL